MPKIILLPASGTSADAETFAMALASARLDVYKRQIPARLRLDSCPNRHGPASPGHLNQHVPACA